MKEKRGIIIAGAIIGILSVLLVYFGNPRNMGACVACFIRDTAGALGLHRAEVVQYIRPEIIGMVLGAFLISLGSKEFKVKGGSSPFLRFILGFVVMVGALMFLGCPLRMVLRLAGGDLNALVGLLGFAAGIFLGIQFLNKGFSLKRNYTQTTIEGYALPLISVGLLALSIISPAYIILSQKGPGSQHAPIYIALAAGLIIGVAAQKTRLCMVGGIRDLIMFKDTYLISGFIAIFIFTLIGNLILGYFKLGFAEQSIAHADGLWNFLGNVDSAITIMGMVVGAAFAHNFKLAASAQGPTANGKVAVIIGFVILGLISYFNIEKTMNFKVKGGVSVD